MPETEALSRGNPLPEGKPTRPSAPATGTDTVTVACKVANGIVLEVSEMRDVDEPTGFGGGTRTTKKAFPVGERFVLRGNAVDRAPGRRDEESEFPRAGGAALTSGIPRDFWERWLEQHRNDPVVTNNLVFAHGTLDGASGMSRERKDVESGLEGIDPADPAKRTGIRAVSQGERAR